MAGKFTNSSSLSFWNNRSVLGGAAGTNDLLAKQLEIEAIASYVRPGMRILDFGCGNGITALELAQRFSVDLTGIDYAEGMISAAIDLSGKMELKGKVQFHVADHTSLCNIQDRFDLVYSERALINLKNWDYQRQAIEDLTGLLKPGGVYVMCENSEDGLDQINQLRETLGLPPISPPWHNRYLQDKEIESLLIPGVKLDHVDHYSSTYYLLSRVINAALAAAEGKDPAYDAPINRLALSLPPLGTWGQGKIWVWRRTNGGE